MLIIASGEDEAVPEELNGKASDFLVLPISKAAHIHLNSLLQSKEGRCSVSPAMAKHLIRPSGLASLVLMVESYLRRDVLNKAMGFDVTTCFEISDQYISKLTETTIMFLESCEDMIERFKGIKILSNFFLGVDNVITQVYISILNWCQE